jgi:hypothetical protein
MAAPFSIQVIIDSKGVQGLKILGDSWEQPQAYALLEKISPLIQKLDALIKLEFAGEKALPSKESVQ